MGIFKFKQFDIDDSLCGMKVGTDSVLLGAWTDIDGVSSVVDAGAGSGLLSLMIAQRCPDADITAVEIDLDAHKASLLNFSRSPWAARIHAICTDISDICIDGGVDMIITNPPYFTSELKSPDQTRALARHASGGLSPLTAIDIAQHMLKDAGSIAMVTPYEYDEAVTYHTEMSRLKVWRKCIVSTSAAKPPTRILWQITKDRHKRYQQTRLTIREPANKLYTAEYIRLTQSFYLNM